MEGTYGSTSSLKALYNRFYSAWTTPLFGSKTDASNSFEAALKEPSYVPEHLAELLEPKSQPADPTSVFDDLAYSGSDSQSDAQSEVPDSPRTPLSSKLLAVLPSLALPMRRVPSAPATPHPEEEPAAVAAPAASQAEVAAEPQPERRHQAKGLRRAMLVVAVVAAAAALGSSRKKKVEKKRA